MSETKAKRKFKCYLCGQEFNSLGELGKHDIKVHLRHQRDDK